MITYVEFICSKCSKRSDYNRLKDTIKDILVQLNPNANLSFQSIEAIVSVSQLQVVQRLESILMMIGIRHETKRSMSGDVLNYIKSFFQKSKSKVFVIE
jgi:hypothetical protein